MSLSKPYFESMTCHWIFSLKRRATDKDVWVSSDTEHLLHFICWLANPCSQSSTIYCPFRWWMNSWVWHECKRDLKIDCRWGAKSAVMPVLYRLVLVNKELIHKAELSIYIHSVLGLPVKPHLRSPVTERIRTKIQAVRVMLLCRLLAQSL